MGPKKFKVYWENSDGTTGESARSYNSAEECVELLDSLARGGAKVWFKEATKACKCNPETCSLCKHLTELA